MSSSLEEFKDMSQYLKRLAVVGLHGRFDLDIAFSEGVNIVYGVNGSGKTTLLHILANATNLDLERFAALSFKTIRLDVADGPSIEYETDKQLVDCDREPSIRLRVDGEEIAALPIESNGTKQRRHSPDDRIGHYKKSKRYNIQTTYFPAFRSMGEVWSFIDLPDLLRSGSLRTSRTLEKFDPKLRPAWPRGSRRQPTARDVQTIIAREIFGEFVPSIDYPAPQEIQGALDRVIQRAVNRLASEDRSLLSEAFNRVFETISQESDPASQDLRPPETIKARIEEILDDLQKTQEEYGLLDSDSAFEHLKFQLGSTDLLNQAERDTTTRVLRVYEAALDQRYDNLINEFATIRSYVDAVNRFLEGKQLVTALRENTDSTPRLQIRHKDGTLNSMETLSSGERQVAGLIYSASRIDKSSAILVDEPELSLHIDWQRKIIGSMERQLLSKQLIVCTHSPIIGAQYEDRMIELSPQPTVSIVNPIPKSVGNGEGWLDPDIPCRVE